MGRLEGRLRRLEGREREEARAGEDRAAQRAASAETLRAQLGALADRFAESGETAHDAAASPMENVAKALARGDFGGARELMDAARERREVER